MRMRKYTQSCLAVQKWLYCGSGVSWSKKSYSIFRVWPINGLWEPKRGYQARVWGRIGTRTRFFLQKKSEWGGVFVDLCPSTIIQDRSIIKAIIDRKEVSTMAYIKRNIKFIIAMCEGVYRILLKQELNQPWCNGMNSNVYKKKIMMRYCLVVLMVVVILFIPEF